MQEIRERLQENAEGTSSTAHLASSSATSFPGRNDCLGTHCSQIEQEEREKTVPAREVEVKGETEKIRW